VIRAANTSCSLWSRHWPATLVRWLYRASGQRKRPARRLRYGVARTDTSDFSARRGRHRRRVMWIRRISCYAEEQATRAQVLPSGLLLWIIDGRDPARKTSRRWPFRSSQAHLRGTTYSTRMVAGSVASPDVPAAPARIWAITRCCGSQECDRGNAWTANSLARPPRRLWPSTASPLLITALIVAAAA
jgi:hypothetical protein